MRVLFRVAYGTCLADDGDLDLSWVSHLVLDFLRDFGREVFRGLVVDLVGADNHAQLAARLDRIGFDHAWIRHRQLLQVVESLDVCFDDLAASAWTCARDGVADLNDGGQERLHLHLVVVRADRVADIRFLFLFFAKLHAEDRVWQFRLIVGHFADVVQQTGPFCPFGIQAQLGGHDGAEIRRFAGVLQKVLPV